MKIYFHRKAGIQSFQKLLDPGLRRGDGAANEIPLKSTALSLGVRVGVRGVQQ
jgi:hypothetical protein